MSISERRYVLELQAEVERLREDLKHADETYTRVAAERNRLGEDLVAQVIGTERLREVLEHGIIAFAGLKRFAEERLGQPIQGGVWPDEARAALEEEA